MHWTAPAARDAGTATLETRLWDAADELRANSGLTSAQYAQPVLGLIFLRFADARFAARRAALETGASARRGSRVDEPGAYHSAGVLYLPLERLKAAIRAQLDRLIAENETRVDFREKFEALIDAYNSGSAQIAQYFEELVKLSQALSAEETRHVREHLAEDELVVFDLLTRPGPDLSSEERDEVKKVCRALLARLRSILLLDWQETALARARVRDAIEETLDEGLPRAYTPELFKQKTGAVFDHVYRRYGMAA